MQILNGFRALGVLPTEVAGAKGSSTTTGLIEQDKRTSLQQKLDRVSLTSIRNLLPSTSRVDLEKLNKNLSWDRDNSWEVNLFDLTVWER